MVYYATVAAFALLVVHPPLVFHGKVRDSTTLWGVCGPDVI